MSVPASPGNAAVPVKRDFTATVFVVHEQRTLLLFHRKLNTWLPPGGHLEPNELPHEAGLREVREETGLDVDLIGSDARTLYEVRVLPQPRYMLLENIAGTHQDIDLIYFAAVRDMAQQHPITEQHEMRWFTCAGLETTPMLLNVRHLGTEAITFVNQTTSLKV